MECSRVPEPNLSPGVGGGGGVGQLEFQFGTHAWTRVLENTPKRVDRHWKIHPKRVHTRGSLFFKNTPFHAFSSYNFR